MKMEKIWIEDFEKHGFEVDIIERCEDEETLCEVGKDGHVFKLYFDDNGEYVRLYDSHDGVFADEVDGFNDLLGELAYKVKHAYVTYKRRSILAKMVYDKLMKEIEK